MYLKLRLHRSPVQFHPSTACKRAMFNPPKQTAKSVQAKMSFFNVPDRHAIKYYSCCTNVSKLKLKRQLANTCYQPLFNIKCTPNHCRDRATIASDELDFTSRFLPAARICAARAWRTDGYAPYKSYTERLDLSLQLLCTWEYCHLSGGC